MNISWYLLVLINFNLGVKIIFFLIFDDNLLISGEKEGIMELV